MEKYVRLNPAWFEPGPDGESPFVRKYNASPGTAGEAIAAAFRALIAEDAAQEVTPPALQVGDVVRLEDVPDATWIKHNLSAIGHIGKIYRIDSYNGEEIRAAIEPDWYWPVSALTLIRRAGAPLAVDDVPSETDWQKLEAERDELKARLAAAEKHFDAWVNSGLWCWNVGGFSASLCWADLCDSLNYNKAGAPDRRAGEAAQVDKDAKDAEIAELRAEVERWKSIADAHEQNYRAMLRRVDEVVAERDALRARIDAGVPVWGSGSVFGGESSRDSSDTHTALLIDTSPIAQDTALVDDRTGKADRREIGCDASYEARIAVGRDHTREYQTEDIDCDGTINCARSNDRRRTPGTIADRGKA